MHSAPAAPGRSENPQEPEAEQLLLDVEAENDVLVRDRPELSATMAGEIRCLRAIVHTVLKDMTRRLA